MRPKTIILFTAYCLLLTASSAQPPPLINYQGRLVDGTNLVSGVVPMAFRIYTNEVGGAHLFESTNLVTVVDGLYATVIGEYVTAGGLDDALDHPQVWLEVEVDGATLSPRERILTVPYARRVHGLRVGSNASVTLNPDQNNLAADIWSVVGGGLDNSADGAFGTVGGGGGNTASGVGSTVAGGGDNVAGGDGSTIGGGQENSAGALFGTVPGGLQNAADGSFSFAAGRRAKANHIGAFVWADSTNADFPSATSNEFAVRAANGLRLVGGSFIGDGSGLTGIPGGAVSGGDLEVERIKVGLAHVLSGTHSSIGGGENNAVTGHGSVHWRRLVQYRQRQRGGGRGRELQYGRRRIFGRRRRFPERGERQFLHGAGRRSQCGGRPI